MELQSKFVAPVAKTVYSTLKNAYQYRQQARVNDFLKNIDLCYETMSLESQRELNEHIESDAGKELLAGFSDAILQTSSRKVRMALAILYCNDREFPLKGVDLHVFVNSMVGITDDLIDFFIMAAKLKCQTNNLPYPRTAIHNKNCHLFQDKGWNEEAIFVNVNDLIRRRLLLPDNSNYLAEAGSGDGWAVWFGVTSKTTKMVSLFEKAEALLKQRV